MSFSTILLIFSIAITAAIGIIGVWFDKDKIEGKWKKILLSFTMTILIVVGGALTYYMTKDNEEKNEEYQKAEKESREILQKAKEQIDHQSAVIEDGFSNLSAKVSAVGVSDAALLSSMKNLQTQVTKLSKDSQKYISNVLKISDGDIDLGPKMIHVKVGQTVLIDTKNTVSVLDGKPDIKGKIKVILNGRTNSLVPGDRRSFHNENGIYSFLVYKGPEKNEFIFYAHER